jgi:hypothetical protein
MKIVPEPVIMNVLSPFASNTLIAFTPNSYGNCGKRLHRDSSIIEMKEVAYLDPDALNPKKP